MTARATDGETEQRERGRVRHVVQGIAPALHLIGGIDHVGPEEVERRRDLRVRIAGEKFIARQLFTDETVVGLVRVESPHHVVAVAPRVGPRRIVLEPVALRKARQIQPVPPPPLAVVRRGQQPVNERLIGTRRRVAHKRIDLCQRRRQPHEIEGHAADQHLTVSWHRRAASLRLQTGQDKRIERRFRPRGLLHHGQLRSYHRLKRPVCPIRLGERKGRSGRRGSPGHDFSLAQFAGVNGPVANPRGNDRDFRLRQLVFLVRHPGLFLVGDHPLEQTQLRSAEDHRRPTLSPAQQRRVRREVEPRFGFLTAVTRHTMLLEQRQCRGRMRVSGLRLRWQGNAQRYAQRESKTDTPSPTNQPDGGYEHGDKIPCRVTD